MMEERGGGGLLKGLRRADGFAAVGGLGGWHATSSCYCPAP